MTITVSQLRAMLEKIPGDTVIIGAEEDHTFYGYHSLPFYTKVWKDVLGGYTIAHDENVQVGEEDDELGIVVNALIIE